MVCSLRNHSAILLLVHWQVTDLIIQTMDLTVICFNMEHLQHIIQRILQDITESSLAFMEQMNNWKTDRRFLYFQHSNTLVKNLNLFTTLEADLYQLVKDSQNNETYQNKFSLTGLYVSLSYRPTGKLSLSGSYDARKNVMYYETYKTYVDRILEDELRQGFRLQASYRITRDLTFGLQSGYRFLKSDPAPSRNFMAI